MNAIHTRHHQSEVRTSASHPLRIDEVAAGDSGGRIGITFCPGKCGPSGSGYVWQRDLAADLDVVATWKPDAVVTLIENHEFAMLGVVGLGAEVEQRGINWCHLPIVDVRPPDARFEAGWEICSPGFVETLRQGGRVLVHCRGGLGRAGTVAARLLVELGIPPQDSVAKVRAARPRAIETNEQLRYVFSLGRSSAAR